MKMNYLEMNREQLLALHDKYTQQYQSFKLQGLTLDMSRGKPGPEQLDMSEAMLTAITSNADCYTGKTDCRNYGIVDGLLEAREMFAEILGVEPAEVICGGNSSLNMMYDTVMRAWVFGVAKWEKPWSQQGQIKFLCPVPGYDRHFGICEQFGIEMINVDMLEDGPDMDAVEELIKDPQVKGIWCVPKHSNPTGVTYSDEVVRRFAALKPAASDFRIFWDNAYCVHELYFDRCPQLLNLMEECRKLGSEDMVYQYTSTSKISFPGGGVSAFASSERNIHHAKKLMSVQSIGPDKLNQLRHIRFFKNAAGVKEYMKKHAEFLRPKFEVVINNMERYFGDSGIATWNKPTGGYFINFNTLEGCASKVAQLAKEAGLILTTAGATFPYGKDPKDCNLRIAPSYPSTSELDMAIRLLCVCVKLVSTEKLLAEYKD